EAVFVCSIIREGHLGHGINGRFKHSHRGGRMQRRDAEAVPLVATRRFSLERATVGVSTAQGCIPGRAGFILANKHTVVVRKAFIYEATVHTVAEYHRGDPSPTKVCNHPGIVGSRRWQREG